MGVKDEDLASMLEEAIGLMNSKGAHWTKGSYLREIGYQEYAYCSVGAIRTVVNQRYPGSATQYHVRDQLTEQLADVLPDAYDVHRTPEDKIVAWNDNLSTTWPKVRYRFQAAVKKLRNKT